jgi:hypothetical protein
MAESSRRTTSPPTLPCVSVLLLPPDVPAIGAYTLGAVLYDPATGVDLPTRDGEQLGRLAMITVVEP